MTRLITSLADIQGRYDALYVDLWGCLHNGVRPFPDAVKALQQYRRGGGIVVLLTNAPRPRGSVTAQLDTIGVPTDAYDAVTSSGDASQAGMLAGLAGKNVYHLGPEKDHSFFDDLDPELGPGDIRKVPLEQAEGIICTGLFDDLSETPEDYRATLLYAKQKGLVMLCTNPDLQVDYGENRIYCAGAVAALYTEMGGQSLYFGKPHPPIYDLARNRVAGMRPVSDDRVLCIGDGIRTDVLGGLNEGFDTLFITGGLAAGEFGDDPDAPDENMMARYFEREQISPTMAISRLR
ncbi:MAG: TIGR01459 family HAD-type hydrolase [Paracoccaceae bacterium]